MSAARAHVVTWTTFADDDGAVRTVALLEDAHGVRRLCDVVGESPNVGDPVGMRDDRTAVIGGALRCD